MFPLDLPSSGFYLPSQGLPTSDLSLLLLVSEFQFQLAYLLLKGSVVGNQDTINSLESRSGLVRVIQQLVQLEVLPSWRLTNHWGMYRPSHIHGESLYKHAFSVHKSFYTVEHQLEPIVEDLDIVAYRGRGYEIDLRKYLDGVVL